MTRNWQIQIPKIIREQLNITKPTQMAVTTQADGSIVVKPVKSEIRQMAGTFKNYAKKKPEMDFSRMRDYIDYSEL